jgi:hypothetical protein
LIFAQVSRSTDYENAVVRLESGNSLLHLIFNFPGKLAPQDCDLWFSETQRHFREEPEEERHGENIEESGVCYGFGAPLNL